MAKMPKLTFMVIGFCLVSCSAPMQQACQHKLSALLVSQISDSAPDDRTFEITVIVSDTTGLRDEYGMLTFPNSSVALGHLTRSQILSLCRHKNVLQIDRSKTFSPK